MKKKTGLMALMMIITTIMFAQQYKGGEGKHHFSNRKDRYETMKTVLSLDEKQDASIKAIQAKYAEKQRNLYKDSLLAADAKRASSKELQKERKKEIDAVLTPAQKTTWESYKKEQAAKRKEQHKQNIEKRYTEMKTSLSLSDDQVSKIKAADEAFRKKIQETRQKNKSDKGDKTAFKTLKAEHDAAIKNILTEEQLKKWSSIKEEKRSQHKRHQGRKKR